MARNAVAVRTSASVRLRAQQAAVIIDLRTRRPWRPPAAPTWPFLLDMAITLTVVALGAWLFIKMRGG